MLKSVADGLLRLWKSAVGHHESNDLSRSVHLREMAEFLKFDTLDLVETTVPIMTGFSRMVDAAKLYSASVQTDATQRANRFQAFKVALRNFAAVLDTAQVSERALILHTVDPTQVPNPLADIV